jgi:hypothetical protein
VLLVWTRRLGARKAPSPVEDAFDPDRIEHVRVGPLSVGAIHQVIRRRLSRTVRRPTLIRLHEVADGNPFYALELARALGAEDGVRDPTQPLPVPERLEELVSARLGGFTGHTREALVLASAEARLTPDQLARIGIERRALDPALGEKVVELADATVRFTHPLLASALYQALSDGERQQAHRRLADVADDPVARARHLALSTDTPDAALAAALEDAAAAASVHGAPTVAAELGEHAIRLTPARDRSDLDRRVAAAAGRDANRARAAAEGERRLEGVGVLVETVRREVGEAVRGERPRQVDRLPARPDETKLRATRHVTLNAMTARGLPEAEELIQSCRPVVSDGRTGTGRTS